MIYHCIIVTISEMLKWYDTNVLWLHFACPGKVTVFCTNINSLLRCLIIQQRTFRRALWKEIHFQSKAVLNCCALSFWHLTEMGVPQPRGTVDEERRGARVSVYKICPRHTVATGRLVIWRLLKRTLFNFFGLEQSWRIFFRALAQISANFRQNSFAYGNLSLLAPYFLFLQRRLSAAYMLVPRAGARLARSLHRSCRLPNKTAGTWTLLTTHL